MTDSTPDPLEAVERVERSEDDGGIGVFPSWGWLYATVVIYGVVTIVILRLLTVTMNVEVGP